MKETVWMKRPMWRHIISRGRAMFGILMVLCCYASTGLSDKESEITITVPAKLMGRMIN